MRYYLDFWNAIWVICHQRWACWIIEESDISNSLGLLYHISCGIGVSKCEVLRKPTASEALTEHGGSTLVTVGTKKNQFEMLSQKWVELIEFKKPRYFKWYICTSAPGDRFVLFLFFRSYKVPLWTCTELLPQSIEKGVGLFLKVKICGSIKP